MPDEDYVDSPDDRQNGADATTENPVAPRWFQRVVPVTGLVLALLVVASLLFSGVRDQVGLSLTRQSQPYVELYFTRAPDSATQATCVRKGDRVRVRFVIASHLDDRQAVAWHTTIDPKRQGIRTQRKAGEVRVTPQAAVEVTNQFRLPRREAYTVSVLLPDSEQRLRAHCAVVPPKATGA